MRSWTRAVSALATIVTATAPAAPAAAAAGDLDPAFTGDGTVVVEAREPLVARAVALQQDGRIIVAGHTCTPGPSGNGVCAVDGDSSFAVARFLPGGALDTEWGHGGLVVTPVGAGRSQAFDVVVQPNGRVVAGGVARDRATGLDSFALVGYDTRGRLDPLFGAAGIAISSLGAGFSAIAAMAAAPDGSIAAAGQGTDAAGRRRPALARYRADGRLDAGFGPFGSVLLSRAGYGVGLGAWLAPGGDVVVAGIGAPDPDPDRYRMWVGRATISGTPDTRFAGDGDVAWTPGYSSSFASAVTGGPDGRWIAAGAAGDDQGREVMAIARGLPDGAPDATWDGDGIALVRTLDASVAADVQRLADGRVLAAGHATTAAGAIVFAMALLDDAGRLDPTFGGGVVTTAWPGFRGARATGSAIDPNGRAVVTGIGCVAGTGTQCDGGTARLLLARYLLDPPGLGAGAAGAAAQ